MSTIGKDIGLGCGRAALIQIIAAVVGLPLALGLVGFCLWLATTFYDRPLVVALGAGAALALFLGGVLALMVIVILRRNAQLDAVFEPLGLTGEIYQTFFRQYHGTVQGRAVSIYFYRGPVLEIEVATPLQVRLGITHALHADTRLLAGMANHRPLTFDAPSMAAMMVFAQDEAWARRLMARPGIPARLERMTEVAHTMFTRHQVRFYPGACQLMLTGSRRLFGIDLSSSQARAWIDDLLGVVVTAEALPEPGTRAELSGVERLAQRTRALPKFFLVWVALITLVLFGAVAVMITILVFVLL